MIEVVEYTDPSCSWAWGSEPKLRRLQWRFEDRLQWRRIMGGLLPYGWLKDWGVDDRGYFNSPEYARKASGYFAKVSETTGMPYPARLDWGPLSSIEMCRAVKAAERQGDEAAGRLIRHLREDFYVFGRPSDSPERILASAAAVPGLDSARLARDLEDPAVEEAYQADWEEARRPNEAALSVEDPRVGFGRAREQNGRMRYGFVTLIFRGPGGDRTVPGFRPWEAYVEAMEEAAPGSTASPRPDPTPVEALERWPLLARAELEMLCGTGSEPPAGAVAFDSGGGVVWMTPAEAATRDVVRT